MEETKGKALLALKLDIIYKESEAREKSSLSSPSPRFDSGSDNFSSPIAWYILTRKATQTLHHDNEENTSKKKNKKRNQR